MQSGTRLLTAVIAVLVLMFAAAALVGSSNQSSVSNGGSVEKQYQRGFLPPMPGLGQPGTPSAPSHSKLQFNNERAREVRAQEWMAFSALWMLVVTTIGVLFVGITVVQTRGVLGESRRATQAAKDAVGATERYGYFQSRPYLSHHDCKLEFMDARGLPDGGDNALIIVDLQIRNSGATPAILKQGLFDLAVSEKRRSKFDEGFILAKLMHPAAQIPAGFSGSVRLTGEINWSMLQDKLQKDGTIWVRGDVHYSAIFEGDRWHRMSFRYFNGTQAYQEGGGFDRTAGGNEAT